jgi:hypothetical protein
MCWCQFATLLLFVVVWVSVNNCVLSVDVEAQQQAENFLFNHTTATLKEARSQLAATSSGELVFFAAGLSDTGPSDQVDILNVSSGIWTTTNLKLVIGLQPHPHEVLSSLVEVTMEQYLQIELIFTTFQVEVGALQLSLDLVQLLQPHQLKISFYLVEV